MKLAAIDIGSNAIRLQIVRVYDEGNLVSFKKLEFLRFPLRLGQDVFTKGEISVAVSEKFVKLMTAFKLFVELYEVDGYVAVATSAMREASNAKEVNHRILNKAIIPILYDGNYVHIDVGGGSTELNLIAESELIESRSFKIGSVRKLSPTQRSKVFSEIRDHIKLSPFYKKKNVIGIGTGGNINRLYGLANKANNKTLSLAELKALRAYVAEFTYDQRMSILKMNPDRADVIIPASEIYIRVLKEMGSDQILVPKVGLKDGLVYELYERTTSKKLEQIEYLG